MPDAACLVQARSTKSRARINQYYALTKAAERKGATKGLQLDIGSERLGKKVRRAAQ